MSNAERKDTRRLRNQTPTLKIHDGDGRVTATPSLPTPIGLPKAGSIFSSSDPDRQTDSQPNALSWEAITAKAKALELKHKGKLPVLTREEERTKFAERDRVRNDKTSGMEEINAAKVRELENELLLHHLGLVYLFVERYLGYGADRDDLVQQAYFGLRRAVEMFEVERGFRLGSYAEGKIRSEMRRVRRTQTPTIQVPVAEQASARALAKIHQQLVADLHRNPTIAELVAKAGFSKEKVEELLSNDLKLGIHKELDKPIGNGETFQDLLSDPTDPSTEERALQFVDVELVEDILAHLAYLDPLGREVLKRRKGFRTGKPETLVSIAESLDLSQTEVWEIEERVVRELSMLFNPKYAEAVTKRNEKAALMPELYPTFTEEQIIEAVPNERQRGFLRAFFIDKKTHVAIASQYDCSQSTVSRNIKAGIDRLTSLIDDVSPMILSA